MSVLRLPHEVYQDLRAHGEETYPEESCGVLLGRPAQDGWHVESAVGAANALAGQTPRRFEIASADLVRIVDTARRRGLEIAGFYHCHPDHPAEWSETDLAGAHWVGCSYVITEVARGTAAATRAFLLAGTAEEDKRFVELEIAIADAVQSASARNLDGSRGSGASS